MMRVTVDHHDGSGSAPRRELVTNKKFSVADILRLLRIGSGALRGARFRFVARPPGCLAARSTLTAHPRFVRIRGELEKAKGRTQRRGTCGNVRGISVATWAHSLSNRPDQRNQAHFLSNRRRLQTQPTTAGSISVSRRSFPQHMKALIRDEGRCAEGN